MDALLVRLFQLCKVQTKWYTTQDAHRDAKLKSPRARQGILIQHVRPGCHMESGISNLSVAGCFNVS